jgi:hypothetical protein
MCVSERERETSWRQRKRGRESLRERKGERERESVCERGVSVCERARRQRKTESLRKYYPGDLESPVHAYAVFTLVLGCVCAVLTYELGMLALALRPRPIPGCAAHAPGIAKYIFYFV